MRQNQKIKQEFDKWIGSLEKGSLSTYEKKVLNLLIENLNEIIPLGTAQGQRAIFIGKKIEEQYKSISDKLNLYTEEKATEKSRNIKLYKLTIGPFRGFQYQHSPFLFDRKYTFLYGPNGSGKTCFCEGLEYSLLGSINEAASRRIELQDYIKNIFINKANGPELIGLDDEGARISIKPKLYLYRFAFIEKNRIEKFARLSANEDAMQRHHIAILFGLESFFNFVKGFTDELDQRYITLENKEKILFEGKKQKNLSDENRLEEINSELKTIGSEIQNFVQSFGNKNLSSLEEIRTFLNGKDGTSGKINELQQRKVENIPADLDSEIIEKLCGGIRNINKMLVELEKNLTELNKESLSIKYKKLYEAVTSIKNQKRKVCPACKTPIKKVTINPFENASRELQKLMKLSDLENNIRNNSEDVFNSIQSTNNLIHNINNNIDVTESSLKQLLPLSEVTSLETQDTQKWKKRLVKELNSLINELKKLAPLKDKIKFYNDKLKDKRKEKKKTDRELKKFQEARDQMTQLAIRRESLLKTRKELQKEITKFKLSNKLIIKRIEETDKKINELRNYTEGYQNIIKKLKLYRDNLPIKLANNLSKKIVEYYNKINCHDLDCELLNTIRLPSNPTERLSLEFKGGKKKIDILYILSEGHLRVLGLSILLAKAVSEDLTFLIFDDIVNAIDDDHRDGIAELLMTHKDFKDRQMIVSCHGEQFIRKLENKLGPSQTDKQVTRYKFNTSDFKEWGVKAIQGDTKNYLVRAKKSLEEGALKEAAFNCRCAMECLSEFLWRKIAKKFNVYLSVKIRTLFGQPDLSSIVDALIKEMKNIDQASEIHETLKKIKDNYTWSLLNKGAHEQGTSPEFEKFDIEELLTLVESLDKQINNMEIKSEINSLNAISQETPIS